jgi:hypothetical protein
LETVREASTVSTGPPGEVGGILKTAAEGGTDEPDSGLSLAVCRQTSARLPEQVSPPLSDCVVALRACDERGETG